MKISEYMKLNGLWFNKKLGQNFLVDDNIKQKIVDSFQLKENENILEIGGGLGSISEYILKHNVNLTIIEIDKGFSKILKTNFSDSTIINEDILKLDLSKFTNVDKVVGNLPYYITSPILMMFLESDINFKSLHFMMQKEVAKRIISKAGSKDYSVLTICANLLSEIEYNFDISPNCFYPKPKVDSALLTFKKRGGKDYSKVIKLVKRAFSKRRKTIKNNLLPYYDIERLKNAFNKVDIDLNIRAEKIEINQYIELTKVLDNE